MRNQVLAFADDLFLGIVLQSYVVAGGGSAVARNWVSMLGVAIHLKIEFLFFSAH